MTTSNLHGWEFILPHDIEFVWDGISDSDSSHVKILKGEFLQNGQTFLETTTANGTITFNLNAVLDTDPHHMLLLMPPPNHFYEGVAPMNALLRTDWYNHNPIQYCWKILVPNKKLFFKKGTPFLFILNYPINLVENTSFTIKEVTPEIKNNIFEYANQRSEFYKNNEEWLWAHMYKHGVDKTTEDANKYLDKVYKPKPQKPKIEGNDV